MMQKQDPAKRIMWGIIRNGLLPTVLLITFYSAMIYFKLDSVAERTVEHGITIKRLSDTVSRHSYVLFDRDVPKRDTIWDTNMVMSAAILPERLKVYRRNGRSITGGE